MNEPYRLVRTPDYLADLEQLSGLAGETGGARAEEWLTGGLKLLEARPESGYYLSRSDRWLRRWIVVPGLLMVTFAYQIREADREVLLLGVRPVDLHTL